MRRAEILAKIATGGLLAIAVVLLIGGILFGGVAIWAACMAAFAQAAVAGLAAWGLTLARQQAELEVPASAKRNEALFGSGFRMGAGDDGPAGVRKAGIDEKEVRTLETGFQRVVVALAGVTMLILAFVSAWLVWGNFKAFNLDPAKGFPIPAVDKLTVVMVLGALAGYIVLLVATRPDRRTGIHGEAVNGLMTLGLPGMVAMAAATLLSWMRVTYASEIAASIVAILLAVQGLELLVNSMRSYTAVEEFDQEPVDLQATPLTPMLTSVWIGGLKMLLGQSFGVFGGEQGQRGVVARMMPRALAALAILALLVSMIRIVPPGEVAVLERFGQAKGFPDVEEIKKYLLQPGLHITLPWPMDELVYIPKDRVRSLTVGAEIESPSSSVDFRFWTFRHVKENDTEGEFITGDHDPDTGNVAPQLLEAFAGVWWRVNEPAKFYTVLSHSEFYEKAGEGTTARPIYEALIQQTAEYVMTRIFAEHSGDAIMTAGRVAIERYGKELLQQELNDLGAGIEVVQFNIKDVHPPYGNPMPAGPTGKPVLGPAQAYEDVVRAMEEKEAAKNVAEKDAFSQKEAARGEAAQKLSDASAYRAERIGKATGEASWLHLQTEAFANGGAVAKGRLFYEAIRDVFPGLNKIIVGPGVKPPQVWQTAKDGSFAGRPPAAPGPAGP